MAFDLDDDELRATREMHKLSDKNVAREEEIKENIEYWESEVQKALKENDISKAIGCRILANKLREDIGEKKI